MAGNFSNLTSHNDTVRQYIDLTTYNDTARQVVFSNTEEQVFSLLFIGGCGSFTTVAQLLVLITIIKSPSLHNVHFYIIAGYCCSDLLGVLIVTPNYMAQFIFGEMPTIYCRVVTTFMFTIILGMPYHTGLIAFDRYLYFCQPYKYNEYLSTKRVIGAMVVCYAIPTVIGVTTEILIGRTYHASILACNLPDSAIQSTIQFMVILLPSAVITIFSVLKVWKLTQHAQVAPQQHAQRTTTGAGVGAIGAGTVTPVKQALKALRMVLLLSGTFWGTMIPGYIARIVVLNVGFTWDDLDFRRYMAPAVSMRLATFAYTSISSTANPLIYYYSRKDLRAATWRLLRRNVVHNQFNSDT